MPTTATTTPTDQDQAPPPVKNRGGRPRVGGLPAGPGFTPQFKVTPEPGQLDQLDAAAKAVGVSRSELVRRFINEGLAREGRKVKKNA